MLIWPYNIGKLWDTKLQPDMYWTDERDYMKGITPNFIHLERKGHEKPNRQGMNKVHMTEKVIYLTLQFFTPKIAVIHQQVIQWCQEQQENLLDATEGSRSIREEKMYYL